MAQHTPGPWSVGDENRRDSSLMVYCDDATGGRVADCTNQYVQHPVAQKRANARLIAAAPDLLAACEMALATFRRDREEEIDDREPEIAALRAVLAKAHGEGE